MPPKGKRRYAKEAPRELTEKEKRAWRAVRAFNRHVPDLQKYARAVTGNPRLILEASAEGSDTDGQRIRIKPPIALGDDIPHDRMNCNQRNPVTRRQLCKACDVRELVLASVYHEIAHIAFGSFVTPNRTAGLHIAALVREWHPDGACDHAEEYRAAVAEMVKNKVDSYFGRFELFHPVLLMLGNSMEDARVNSATFIERPGTRNMMYAHITDVFNSASERYTDGDDDADLWQNQEPDPQMLIGAFLVASSYYEQVDMLMEKVQQDLNDPDLADLLDQVAQAPDAHEAAILVVRVFRRLQEMGYLHVPKCAAPEVSDAPPSSDESSSSGSDESGDGEEGEEGGDGQPGSGMDGEDGSAGQGGSSPADQGDAEGGGPEGGDRAVGSTPGGAPGAGGAPSADGGPGGDRADNEADPAGQSGSDGRQDVPGDDGDPGAAGEDAVTGPVEGQPEDKAEARGAEPDGDSETDQPDGDGMGEAGSDMVDAGAEQPVGEGGGGDADGGTSGPGTDAHGDVGGDQEEPGGAPSPPTPADIEALRRLVQQMTLHQLFRQVAPDTDVDCFAMGKVDLHDDGVHLVLGIGGEEGGDPTDGAGGGWGDGGEMSEEFTKALTLAIQQSQFFDAPATGVTGIDVLTFPHNRSGWFQNHMYPSESDPATYMPSQAILGRVITEARLTFEENKRSRYSGGLKSGKINARVLGKRAPVHDPHLFKKKQNPTKRDYFAVISGDASGSTTSYTVADLRDGSKEPQSLNHRIKAAIFGQAEMLSALGIPFEIWMHTAGHGSALGRQVPLGGRVWMMQVKTKDEPWDTKAKVRLASVQPVNGNLDGHTLEFLRKRAEMSRATDKILCYYTDGAMPAMNATEEAQVLRRETEHCKKNNITLLAVGIGTDSPKAYGFDTVEVNSEMDLVEVVRRLGRALTE